MCRGSHSSDNMKCDTYITLPALYCDTHRFIYQAILIIDKSAVDIYLNISVCLFRCAGLTETNAKPSSLGLAELGKN